MGQRTHLVIVTEDKTTNTGKAVIYYHPWGIGRIMPATLMSMIPNVKFGLGDNFAMPAIDFVEIDKLHLGYVVEHEYQYRNGKLRFDDDKTSAPENLSDWRDAKITGKIMKRFDNNNGCLFIFVTIDNANFSYKTKFELAWMLGWEDAYYSEIPDRHPENKKYGAPFSKWLTTNQWMSLDINSHWWKDDKEFKNLFNTFLAYFNVTPLNNSRNRRNAA